MQIAVTGEGFVLGFVRLAMRGDALVPEKRVMRSATIFAASSRPRAVQCVSCAW